MIRLFISSVFVVISLSSCIKINLDLTSPQPAEGKFVVDSIGTTAVVKQDSVLKEMQTFLTLALVYHYENSQGSLDKISLSINDSIGVTTFIDYISPESINTIHRFKTTYGIRDSFSGKDNIKITRGLSGSFIREGRGGDYGNSGDFSWKDSLYVHVDR